MYGEGVKCSSIPGSTGYFSLLPAAKKMEWRMVHIGFWAHGGQVNQFFCPTLKKKWRKCKCMQEVNHVGKGLMQTSCLTQDGQNTGLLRIILQEKLILCKMAVYWTVLPEFLQTVPSYSMGSRELTLAQLVSSRKLTRFLWLWIIDVDNVELRDKVAYLRSTQNLQVTKSQLLCFPADAPALWGHRCCAAGYIYIKHLGIPLPHRIHLLQQFWPLIDDPSRPAVA